MKSIMLRVALTGMLAGGLSGAVRAEEAAKTLPTLLIKGEVVSLDTTDPAATLLKVKDRYGFETPIFLTSETKITQGEAAVPASNLATGSSVEVEYNFDVNTAKRHAVSVKLAAPAASAEAPAAAPTGTAEATATVVPAEPAVAQPETTPQPADTGAAAPAAAEPEAAPATQ